MSISRMYTKRQEVELGEFPKAHGPDILASAAQEQDRLCLKEGENQQIAPKVVTLYLHRYCGTHKKKIYIRRENLISIVCQYFKKHTKWQVTKTEFSWAYNILIFENHSERDFNSYLKPYSVKYTIKCVHRLVYVRKSFLAIYLREDKYLEDIKNSWI